MSLLKDLALVALDFYLQFAGGTIPSACLHARPASGLFRRDDPVYLRVGVTEAQLFTENLTLVKFHLVLVIFVF